MEELIGTIVNNQKKNEPVKMKKKSTQPLCKADIKEHYAKNGVEHDFHAGFHDMNKDFIIRR